MRSKGPEFDAAKVGKSTRGAVTVSSAAASNGSGRRGKSANGNGRPAPVYRPPGAEWRCGTPLAIAAAGQWQGRVARAPYAGGRPSALERHDHGHAVCRRRARSRPQGAGRPARAYRYRLPICRAYRYRCWPPPSSPSPHLNVDFPTFAASNSGPFDLK